MTDTDRKTAPWQAPRRYDRMPSQIPWDMHLRAYEVYCHFYSEQPALIEDWCRGGFGMEELIAFLYARSFPREEWKDRVREAWQVMADSPNLPPT